MSRVPPFFANVSHEIRTPMNGVIGMLDLLERTPLDVDQRNMVDTARSSAEALLALIDNVLDFTKIDAGKLALENIEVQLRPLAEEVVTLFSHQAQTKGIELSCVVHQNVPATVRGDPTRIRQVMTNLIGNAVKFTDSGEVFLGIRAREHEAQGEVLPIQMVVRDTGIGMTDAVRANLFQAFMQADNSIARKYGGTGLGLAIVHHLVEAMGGSIKVGSEPGMGATFSVILPMTVLPGVAAEDPVDLRPADLRGLKALIVDDNSTQLCVMEHYAANVGVRHHSVLNTNAGLAALREAAMAGDPFDVVLLDYCLSGAAEVFDSADFLRQLRTNPLTAQVPCIVLSSLGERAPQLDALSVAAWLTKPVRQTQLHRTLAGVLGRGAREASAEPQPREFFYPGTRVLLVENDAVNRQVAQRLLRTFDIKPQLAADGADALARIRTMPFDLVLMDCQMPVMDGYDATRAIRQWEQAPRPTNGADFTAHLPIVALTANATEEDRKRCIEAGMDDYLVKPVRREALGAALARHLKPYASATASPTEPPARRIEVGPALDARRIEALCEIFPDDFSRVVETYLREAPAHLDALAAAPAAEWSGIAHTLKSSSRSIGARGVADLAARLEVLARGAEFRGEASGLLRELHAVLADTAIQLRRCAGDYLNEYRAVIP